MIPYSKIFEGDGARNVKNAENKNDTLNRCKTMCHLASIYASYNTKKIEGCYEKCHHKHEDKLKKNNIQ